MRTGNVTFTPNYQQALAQQRERTGGTVRQEPKTDDQFLSSASPAQAKKAIRDEQSRVIPPDQVFIAKASRYL